MKIAILSPSNLSENNGTSIRAKNIYKLLNSEYDVTIISSNNTKFDSLWHIFASTIIWNFKLIKNLSKQKYDCVYSCSDFLGFFTCFSLSKVYGFKLIFEAHGILSEENVKKRRNILILKICNLIEKFVIKNSDHVITLSNKIFKFYGKFNDNVDLIPVFIDEMFFSEEPNTLSTKSKLIGLVGPFDMPANKYYLDFLYKNINNFDNQINFLVIGKCDHRITHEKINYTGYIELTTEYVQKIRSLDALLVPSNLSTSGPLNKILEAMACSIPVFTTPMGLTGLDYVVKNENIFSFNEENLVREINKMIFCNELMLKISKKAKSTAETYYSPKSNSKKLLDIINL